MRAGVSKGEKEGGVTRSLFLSLMIHLLALILLVFMPKPSSSSPPLVSYPVSLVSLKLPEQEQTGVDRAPSSALPISPPVSLPVPPKQEKSAKEAAKSPPRAETTPVLPNRPAQTSTLPDVVPVAPPLQEVAALPSASQPRSGSTTPPGASPQEGLKETTPTPAFSVRGEVGTGGPMLNHPYYFAGIQNKISAHWTPPADIFSSGPNSVLVVIGFVVQPNGQIHRTSIILEKSSGNAFWDASALRAVYNANPLLPLPTGITEALHVHFEFRVRPQS